MHVALVTAAFPEPHPGRYPGIERLARELTDQLLAVGLDVTVVTTSWNGGPPNGRHGRARIIRLPDTSRFLGRFGSLGDSHYWSWGSAVGRTLDEARLPARPDVVHALSPVAATPALVRSHLPVITTFHHYEGLRTLTDVLHKPFHRILEYRAYLTSTLMTTPSQASAETLRRTYGVPSRRIRVVPWGVDLARFEVQDHPAATDIRLLFVGPHEPRKGLEYLLEGLAMLRKEGIPVRLTTVGQGSQLSALRELARNLGISEAVTFRGYVDDSEDRELRRLYAEADVFVFPSLQEGFGLVLVEAMASGLPIVSTRISAIPEVVGDAGILVPPRDPVALASVLRDLAKDPASRLDLARRGRKRAEAEFGWNRVATRLVAVYGEAKAMTAQ